MAQPVNGLTSDSHRRGRDYPKSMVEIISSDTQKTGVSMPAIFDLLYREYCRARLAEMRKQLLIAGQDPESVQADCDRADQESVGRTDTQYEISYGALN
ncbi:hypothetical protein [Bradyrhizobium sp. DASA03007]|uniref:hypothetical protein n=1 Tax=unclassified Bradyrhizobium TaxID=2631580 RepID=UPI003F6F79A9